MKILISLSIFFQFLIVGCGHESSMGLNNDDFTYPIQSGYQWEYKRTLTTYADSLILQMDTVITSTVSMTIGEESLLMDSITAYAFHELHIETNGPTIESVTYYNNTDDGLIMYAYNGPGTVIPKSLPNSKIFFKDLKFNSPQALIRALIEALPNDINLSDSLYFEDPPVQTLKYPIEVGSQWIYRYPHNPWRMEKKVLGKESISVPAGNFECFKIQWLYDMDHNAQWDEEIIFYDYLNAKGLIKRSIRILSPSKSDPSGWLMYEEISDLTHINF